MSDSFCVTLDNAQDLTHFTDVCRPSTLFAVCLTPGRCIVCGRPWLLTILVSAGLLIRMKYPPQCQILNPTPYLSTIQVYFPCPPPPPFPPSLHTCSGYIRANRHLMQYPTSLTSTHSFQSTLNPLTAHVLNIFCLPSAFVVLITAIES